MKGTAINQMRFLSSRNLQSKGNQTWKQSTRQMLRWRHEEKVMGVNTWGQFVLIEDFGARLTEEVVFELPLIGWAGI